MRPLSVTDMRDALREVAERLQRAGVQGRLYVTGGAAMALAYDAERLTRDIDAAITHGHNAVIDAVRAVAAARGWPSTWLNEQATTYMPQIPDRHSQVVFDHPALQVAAASSTHMLAMKARAARAQGTPPNQPALASCGEVQSRLALPTTATSGMSVMVASWGRPVGCRQPDCVDSMYPGRPGARM